MPIANIKIGTRRKDLGDISSGAQHRGRQLAPSGRSARRRHADRRRAAARPAELGWIEIPVTVVDLDDIVRGELAENAERKDFLPSEIDAIRRALEPIEKLAAKERMSEGGKGGKVSQPSDGPVRARDKIGALAGVSGRTVEKIAAVVAAAEAEPEKFGHLIEEMDKNGKVDRAHKQLKIQRQRSKPAGPNDKPLSPEQAQAPSSEPTLFDQAPPLKPQPSPAPKADAAPPPAPGEPAPPRDLHGLRGGGMRDTIRGTIRGFDRPGGRHPRQSTSGVRSELDEVVKTAVELRAVITQAIESATVREKEPPPASRGLREGDYGLA